MPCRASSFRFSGGNCHARPDPWVQITGSVIGHGCCSIGRRGPDMDTSMVEAMIFDLDGTLVDTNEAHVQAWYNALTDFGYDVPQSRIVREIGKGGDKLVPSILGEEGEARDGEALRAAHGAHFLTIAKKEKFRVFAGAEALMGELRRRRINTAVATSSKEEQLEAVVASSGLDVKGLE